MREFTLVAERWLFSNSGAVDRNAVSPGLELRQLWATNETARPAEHSEIAPSTEDRAEYNVLRARSFMSFRATDRSL